MVEAAGIEPADSHANIGFAPSHGIWYESFILSLFMRYYLTPFINNSPEFIRRGMNSRESSQEVLNKRKS